jgi:uncharacterized membrane protein
MVTGGVVTWVIFVTVVVAAAGAGVAGFLMAAAGFAASATELGVAVTVVSVMVVWVTVDGLAAV